MGRIRRMATSAAVVLALTAPGAGCKAPSRGINGERSARAPRTIVPRRYDAPQTAEPIRVDGRLDDAAWQSAAWTESFVDIEGAVRPTPQFPTRAKLAWDQNALYVGAELEEPHVWATLTERDAIVFHDNDFEVFIDPDGDGRGYFEIEVNALGTVFDLFLERPYIEGGPADHGWDARGLRTAIAVEGTLNDPTDRDHQWSVEMAIPWKAFGDQADVPLPPRPGDVWRINFSRVQWQHQVADGGYVKIPDKPEDNWVWSPQGAINMHLPWLWAYVTFTANLSE